MSEIIEMPYGTGKSLTTQELYDIYKALTAELLLCAEAKAIIEDFMKKNSEVQLDVEMKRKQCFVNYHCSNGDCPNAEYETADDRYGFGIADDMGLEQISCKQCCYNTGRCEDCLLEHSKDCPEYKESEDDVE